MAVTGALKHIRNYASAGILASLAGIITFPLLTRNMTVEQYGILGLITSSLTLFIAVGKLGTQNSVIRFFSQVEKRNIAYTMGQLNSTVSLLFVALATATTVLWLILGFFVLPRALQYENIAELFLVASGTVFVRLLGSGFMNFLRAQQRSVEVGASQILIKYLYLLLILLLVFFSELNPYFILLMMMLAEIVGVVWVASRYWPDFHFSLQEWSAPFARAMLTYGIPLMLLESLGLILRLSDRYIIEAKLGVSALGQYSASYNLTAYLDLVLLTAMVQAIRPFYIQLWEGDGLQATRQFLSRALHAYFMVGIPLVALFSLVSPHLLSFLASPKYAPGTIIIPFVAFSFLLDGAVHFLAAGLYIKKNTKVLMIWSALATVLNLVLNLLIIPYYGILGAALVTIVSYAVFLAGVTFRSFRYLSFEVNIKVPLLVSVFSLLTYFLLFWIDLGGDVANLLVKGALGTVMLGAMVLVCDVSCREWLASYFNSLRSRPAE